MKWWEKNWAKRYKKVSGEQKKSGLARRMKWKKLLKIVEIVIQMCDYLTQVMLVMVDGLLRNK